MATGTRRLARRLGVLLLSCSIQVGQRAIFAQRGEVLPVMSDGLARKNIEMATRDGVALRGWYL
jgi:hypothetical protein